MFDNTNTLGLILYIVAFTIFLVYNTFYRAVDMSAVYILKYFNTIWRAIEALRIPAAFGVLAAIGNVLLLPTNFLGWIEGKGERLWLRWHSPQLSSHMEVLRRVEKQEQRDREKAGLLDQKVPTGDDVV